MSVEQTSGIARTCTLFFNCHEEPRDFKQLDTDKKIVEKALAIFGLIAACALYFSCLFLLMTPPLIPVVAVCGALAAVSALALLRLGFNYLQINQELVLPASKKLEELAKMDWSEGIPYPDHDPDFTSLNLRTIGDLIEICSSHADSKPFIEEIDKKVYAYITKGACDPELCKLYQEIFGLKKTSNNPFTFVFDDGTKMEFNAYNKLVLAQSSKDYFEKLFFNEMKQADEIAIKEVADINTFKLMLAECGVREKEMDNGIYIHYSQIERERDTQKLYDILLLADRFQMKPVLNAVEKRLKAIIDEKQNTAQTANELLDTLTALTDTLGANTILKRIYENKLEVYLKSLPANKQADWPSLMTRCKEARITRLTCPKWVTDQHLAAIEGLPLTSLSLQNVRGITDAGMRHTRDMKLEYLKLSGTLLTDACFPFFQDMSLKKLAMSNHMNGSGLQHLKKTLNHLSAEGSQLNDAAFVHLKGMPLENLSIGSCAQVNGSGFIHLQGLPLKSLSMGHTAVNDNCIEHLQGLPLESLYMNDTLITSACLPFLQKMPLQRLDLGETQVEDEGLRSLSGLPLQSLYLKGTTISNEGVAHLTSLPLLNILNLVGTQVDDECLPHIQAMPALSSVYLSRDQVTEHGVAQLKENLDAINRYLLVYFEIYIPTIRLNPEQLQVINPPNVDIQNEIAEALALNAQMAQNEQIIAEQQQNIAQQQQNAAQQQQQIVQQQADIAAGLADIHAQVDALAIALAAQIAPPPNE